MTQKNGHSWSAEESDTDATLKKKKILSEVMQARRERDGGCGWVGSGRGALISEKAK